MNEELAKGKINVSIENLFSKNTVQKAAKEYRKYDLFKYLSVIAGMGIIVALVFYLQKGKKMQWLARL